MSTSTPLPEETNVTAWSSASWALWVCFCHLLFSVKAFVVLNVFIMHNILNSLFPWAFYKLALLEGRITGLCVVVKDPKDYMPSLCTKGFFTTILSDLYCQTNKIVKEGTPAVNTPVTALNDEKQYSLMEFAKPQRPLVIVLGSITCPIFMNKMHNIKQQSEKFSNIADFLLVYTQESHAEDGWKFDNNAYKINQHKSLEERLSAARLLDSVLGNNNITVTVDSMSNETTSTYGALPMRMFIVVDGLIEYEGGMGPMGFSVEAISTWLQHYEAKRMMQTL